MQLSTPRMDDLPELRTLLEDCALPVADLDTSLLPGFLIGRDEGRLVVVGGLQPCDEVVLLRSLAVAASHRQRGLAKLLLAALEARARASRQQQIFLLTTTAQHFFAGCGFQLLPREMVPPPIAGTAQFRHLCPVSAVCMVKALSGELSP